MNGGGQQEALQQWMREQQLAAATRPQQPQQQSQPPTAASLSLSPAPHSELTTEQLLHTLQLYSNTANHHQLQQQPPLLYAAFPSTSTSTAAIPLSSDSFNSTYDDSFALGDQYSYGTPSYCGSYSGEGEEEGSVNPFLSYRHQGDDHSSNASHSHWGATSSTAGSVVGTIDDQDLDDDLGSLIDFDFEPMAIHSPSDQVQDRDQDQSMGIAQEENEEEGGGGRYRQGQRGTFIAPSQQQREASTSNNDSSLVFTSTLLTDSPPVSSSSPAATLASAEFPSSSSAFTRTTSPPSLAPLAIPSDGPSFNLIQPTPHTARPKDHPHPNPPRPPPPSKGPGTLELENLLGMGDWAAKIDQDSSFSDFAPASSSASPNHPPSTVATTEPLLSSHFSSAPESFVPTPTASRRPPAPFDSLTVPRPPPSRRRSRSEADITSPSHFAFPPNPLQPQQQLQHPTTSAVPGAPPLSSFGSSGFDYLQQHQQQFLDLSNHSQQQQPYYHSPIPALSSSSSAPDASSLGLPPPLDINSWTALMTQQQQMHAFQQQQQQYPSGLVPTSQHGSDADGTGIDIAEQVRLHQQLLHHQQQQQQQQQQHELTRPTRASATFGGGAFGLQHAIARGGGPGYHQAGGMFGSSGSLGGAEEGLGAGKAGSHRRSRSHGSVRGIEAGAGRGRGVDYALQGQGQGQEWTSTSETGMGMLAPPAHRSPSIPPSHHSHSDYSHSRSPSPSSLSYTSGSSPLPHSQPPRRSPSFPSFPDPSELLGAHSPSALPPPPPHRASSFHQYPQAHHLSLRAQSTPYVYHSPVASPGIGGGGSPDEASMNWAPQGAARAGAGGKKATGGGGAGGVSRESKTTPATIEAAMRRRNPGSAAKFVCDLCGETFTRRYNLKGHQRAHRNEKPFACSYEGCNKAFARAHDCKRHELLHLNVRRYHCEPCQRDFIRLDALQRHHRSEVGQACVEQLRAQGYEIGYDTNAVDAGVQL